MADEIEVTRKDGAVPVRPYPDTATAPTAAGTPDDPAVARAQIEQTRARMSETIDEIEDALLRKKERIQDKLDVLAPVRERPFPSLGVALGAGILVGFITGDDEDGYSPHHHRDAEERAEMWENRARRLLRIAQEQEEEIEAMAGSDRRPRRADWTEDEEHGEPSVLEKAQDMIADRLAGFISNAMGQMTGAKT